MKSRIPLSCLLLLMLSLSLACASLPRLSAARRAAEPTALRLEPGTTPFEPAVQAGSQPSAEPAPATAALQAAQSPEPTAIPATQTPVSQGTTVHLPLVASATTLWAGPELPSALREALHLPEGWGLAFSREQAHYRLGVATGAAGEAPVSRWIYALVAPFPTLEQAVSSEALLRGWRGEPSGPFAGRPLLLDESTLALFGAVWGAPAPGAVQVVPTGELLQAAWDSRPAWALVPFENLEPRWKVLEVDGASPLRNTFDASAWPLSVPLALTAREAVAPLPEGIALLPESNRDPARLTVAALTGVTALVRATAFTMEQQGIQYPAGDIGGLLRAADLTHISNEVPFAGNCPYPDPVQDSLVFCSSPRYIELLEAVGADIIELTGDHFQDWGQDAMFETLQIYADKGWEVYGGGANLEEGRRALLVEHNGNRLAFIGCNAKGGSFAQAGPDRPGAAACDMDWMAAEVSRLRAGGYLPIATFQHFEYYTYVAQPNQQRDARQLAEAGAVIVSGSQAHQPQAFEFDEDALIHHGLGNLFFDQYDVSQATRQGFVDFHVFYDNRYLGVELLPILFIDYARPRPMTAGEREDLLQAVFSASGW